MFKELLDGLKEEKSKLEAKLNKKPTMDANTDASANTDANSKSLKDLLSAPLSAVPKEEWMSLAAGIAVEDITQLFNFVEFMIKYIGVEPKMSLFNLFKEINDGEITRYKILETFAKVRAEIDPDKSNKALDLLYFFIAAEDPNRQETNVA
jgi:uncharacterized protein YjgD (DUF1641 family)